MYGQLQTLGLASGLALVAPALAAGYDCYNLTLYNGLVDADTFVVVNSTVIPANATSGVPEYCDVNSMIGGRINAWLKFPTAANWNGRFAQYGCGGACGYNEFAPGNTDYSSALIDGYAISTTDMGVQEASYVPYHNNLKAKIDWGYLATHLTAVVSKDIIQAFYGAQPSYSYHLGGSTGGRQGLVEAQRYPHDFDGILARAPALNETGITLFQITYNAVAAVQNNTELTPILDANSTTVLHDAALAACDKLDGLEDGIISDPRGCHFDLSQLVCGTNGTTNSSCLTAEAKAAAEKFYIGPVNSKNVHLVLEGLLPGSEEAWMGALVPSAAGQQAGFYSFAEQYISYYGLYPDPPQPIAPVNFSMDTPLTDCIYIESLLYGGIADLFVFNQLGGKMVMLQGLQDPAVAPWFARDYYFRVLTAMGGKELVEKFFKYYEMPGVNHVSGGPGADTFDELAVISAWVERGEAPTAIIAEHLDDSGDVAFTRPIYPYPYYAYYNGTGDPNNATSFVPKMATDGFWAY